MRAEATHIAERQRRDAEANALRQAAQPLQSQLTELWNDYTTDYSSGLRSRLYSDRQLPYTVTAESMEAWTVTANALIKEVHETRVVAQTARSLRNEVNGLLCDNPDRFVGQMLDDLDGLDVSDDELPGSLAELNSWIARATSAIAKAQAILNKPVPDEGVDTDMLAALANRFGGRR
ncbi:MAG: hypothetical protein ACQR33_04525 [Candidatus Saccharibacteria bacterium]